MTFCLELVLHIPGPCFRSVMYGLHFLPNTGDIFGELSQATRSLRSEFDHLSVYSQKDFFFYVSSFKASIANTLLYYVHFMGVH